MNLTIDASDYAQIAAAWAKAPEIVRTRLLAAITACDLELQSALKQDLPRGAGGAAGLAGSVATQEDALADSVIGAVFTPQPYAVYVELGTGPHWMPIQPLLDWVKVKLGLLDLAGRDVAYAIRGAIAKRGTKANPVWQRTWEAKQPFIRPQFDAAMIAIAGDLAEGAV